MQLGGSDPAILMMLFRVSQKHQLLNVSAAISEKFPYAKLLHDTKLAILKWFSVPQKWHCQAKKSAKIWALLKYSNNLSETGKAICSRFLLDSAIFASLRDHICYIFMWPGYDCSIPVYKGVWSEVMPVGGANARPITSPAAVVIHDQLWVLCGYSFADGRNCSNLARYRLCLLVAVLFPFIVFALMWITGITSSLQKIPMLLCSVLKELKLSNI